MATGSTHVIVTALAANLGIAVAKFVAAAMTGSSAMLTEGVHSLVDCTNQGFLLYGGKRAERPANAQHPLGYGRELYFWSFVVAIMVFALGAGVSVYEGVRHILNPEHDNASLTVAFVVLGVSFALEGWSTIEAMREFGKSRGSKSWLQSIQDSKDAPTIVILLENSGALAGLVIAAIGIGLTALTGNPFWDGLASVLIGLILGALAILLLIEAKSLLIGESADPEIIEALRQSAESHVGVEKVHDVLTIHHAPDKVVSVISADFDDSISAADVERIVADIEAKVAEEFPVVTRLYVRPVSG